MFNIDYQKLIMLLLPLHKRGETILLYLYAAIKPLISMYDEFMQFRHDKKLEATYNSQILGLERYLRNLFGTESITIIDNLPLESVHVYNTREEVDEPYFYQSHELVTVDGVCYFKNRDDELIPLPEEDDIWIYQTHEDEAASYGAIIQVAALFESQEFEAKLQAALQQYIFSDKTYIIQYI